MRIKSNKTDVGDHATRVSRRQFLKAAGASAGFGGAVAFSASKAAAQQRWDQEADVVVVGSGTVLTAAIVAADAGASVVILEKGNVVGGTTRLSGGVFWIPNNPLMKADGIVDEKPSAMRFLARSAYPQHYYADDEFLGLGEYRHSLISAFYDNGAPMVEALTKAGAIKPVYYNAKPAIDYNAQLPEENIPGPSGRSLSTVHPAGMNIYAQGAEFIKQMKAAVDARRIPILLEHRATRLVVNSRHEVVGVEATRPNGEIVSVRGRKGVIFGTGGFTHNKEYREMFLRGPMYSGCGPLTNTGDFIYMATAVGAKLHNMTNAWGFPQVAELAFKTSATGNTSSNGGDSFILVNKLGMRVGDEKARYNERAKLHFHYDAARLEYSNLVLFDIFDQRCRDQARGGDSNAPWLLSGNTLPELATAISKRLAEVAKYTGGFRLDESFADNLKATIERFNGFAETGVDRDFRRGTLPVLTEEGRRPKDNDKPNPHMYPISLKGPYYCIMVVSGTLDTSGGPKINAKAQVLNAADAPIPGLFGAGNCIGGPMGEGYCGYGGTIGPAMTYAYIAAQQVVRESVKQLD
jgi:3-oxosteroid 1-dehydrogenase